MTPTSHLTFAFSHSLHYHIHSQRSYSYTKTSSTWPSLHLPASAFLARCRAQHSNHSPFTRSSHSYSSSIAYNNKVTTKTITTTTTLPPIFNSANLLSDDPNRKPLSLDDFDKEAQDILRMGLESDDDLDDDDFFDDVEDEDIHVHEVGNEFDFAKQQQQQQKQRLPSSSSSSSLSTPASSQPPMSMSMSDGAVPSSYRGSSSSYNATGDTSSYRARGGPRGRGRGARGRGGPRGRARGVRGRGGTRGPPPYYTSSYSSSTKNPSYYPASTYDNDFDPAQASYTTPIRGRSRSRQRARIARSGFGAGRVPSSSINSRSINPNNLGTTKNLAPPSLPKQSSPPPIRFSPFLRGIPVLRGRAVLRKPAQQKQAIFNRLLRKGAPTGRYPPLPQVPQLSAQNVQKFFADVAIVDHSAQDYEKKKSIFESRPSTGTLTLVNVPLFADCIIQVKNHMYFGHSKFLVYASQWFEDWFKNIGQPTNIPPEPPVSAPPSTDSTTNIKTTATMSTTTSTTTSTTSSTTTSTTTTTPTDHRTDTADELTDLDDESGTPFSAPPFPISAYLPAAFTHPVIIEINDLPAPHFFIHTLMYIYTAGRASLPISVYQGVYNNIQHLKVDPALITRLGQMIDFEKDDTKITRNEIINRFLAKDLEKLQKLEADLENKSSRNNIQSTSTSTTKSNINDSDPRASQGVGLADFSFMMDKADIDPYARTSMLLLWGAREEVEKTQVRDSIRRIVKQFLKEKDINPSKVVDNLKAIRAKMPQEFSDCFPADVFLDMMAK